MAFSNNYKGDLLSLTNPKGNSSEFILDSNYNITRFLSPSLDFVGNTPVNYLYNNDGELISVDKPAAISPFVDISYSDDRALIDQVTTNRNTFTYEYEEAPSERLKSATTNFGIKDEYTYFGDKIKSKTISRVSNGFQLGKITNTYDNYYRLSQESLQGKITEPAYNIDYVYNRDGEPLQIGDMSLTYDYPSGRISTKQIGNITDERTYDNFGELRLYRVFYVRPDNSRALRYLLRLTRDNLNRIIEKEERIQGLSKFYNYLYDSTGRLTEVKTDGIVTTQLSYDQNSNISSGIIDGVQFNALFDAQDRITKFNTREIFHNSNGDLSGISDDNDVLFGLSYTYSSLGHLEEYQDIFGEGYLYEVDAQSRRTAVIENNQYISRYVYKDDLRISVETTENGTVKNYYVYDKKLNVPEYFYRRGNDTNYRVITDHIGSVKLILNAETGGIAQLTKYGDLGQVISRTNPNLQPFGFGGGLYDQFSGLVRFGKRDYNPEFARWMSKDPIQFNGGDTNLYAYALQDPINLVDPSGTIVPIVYIGLVGSVGLITAGFSATIARQTGKNPIEAAFVGFCSGTTAALLVGAGGAASPFIGVLATIIGASASSGLTALVALPDAQPKDNPVLSTPVDNDIGDRRISP